MTTPSPEQITAAIERLKGEVAAARRIQKINPFLYHFMDDVDTLIAALAAQSEELANHYHDFKRIRQLMMCDGSDFEQLESKWNSVQAELAQARKVLLEYANPANWIERMGGRGDFEGYDYKPHASGHPRDEASAALQQEQP